MNFKTLIFRELKRWARKPAISLVKRVHYQGANIRGRFIGCYVGQAELKRVKPKFSTAEDESEVLVGVVVLQNGCMYGNPQGRRHLAAKHFPQLDLARMTRDKIVEANRHRARRGKDHLRKLF